MRTFRPASTSTVVAFARAHAFMLASLYALGACGASDATPTNSSPKAAGSIRLLIDPNPSAGVLISPTSATLVYGTGVFLKAQVVDAAGQPVAGARAAWRSTNSSVALVNVLADSTSSSGDWGRAVVASIAPGTAFVIASYGGITDTATITVIPRDSTPARAKIVDLTFKVWGVNASASPADSMARYPKLSGSRVTLTLLPLQAGDSVAAGTTLITAPTVVGTLVADSSASVTFTKVPVTRFSVTAAPPEGTDWATTVMQSGSLYFGNLTTYLFLPKK